MAKAKRGIEGRLARMQDAWDAGKDTPPGVPDGQYLLQLQSCDVREAQSSGKLLTFWEWLVVEGDHEGSTPRDMISLEMESGPYRVSNRIKRLGAEPPDSLENMPAVLGQLQEANPIVQAGIRKSGEFTNVTIQELMDPEPGEMASTAEAEGEETETEFSVGDTVAVEDDEGNTVVAEITALDLRAGTAVLEDDEAIYEEVAIEDLQAAEAEPSGDEPEDEPEDDPAVLALSELADAVGIEDERLDDATTVEGVAEVLSEFEWDAKDLTSDEVEVLESADIEVKKPKPKPKKSKKGKKGKSKGRKKK